MSSKRKSPPTKLQDGMGAAEDAAPLPPTIVGGGSDGGGLTDMDDNSSNNLSDLGEEEPHGEVDVDLVGPTPNAFFNKLSDTSSVSGSASEGDEAEAGIEDERSPPKKQRLVNTNSVAMGSIPNLPPNFPSLGLTDPALAAAMQLSLHHQQILEESRRRNSSECSSPTADIKATAGYIHHNNNNNIALHNNNAAGTGPHSNKRTMDDVLKRLTSKMNSSTLREERRPTPATTPNTKSP